MHWLLVAFATLQLGLAVLVMLRMAFPLVRPRVQRCTRPATESVSIVIPVLNEADRIGGCLAAAASQSTEVGEILVVDGGSRDGTQTIVQTFSQGDPRVRLVDASPIPADAAGKAWGLASGAAVAAGDWLLTLDADVEVDPALTTSLLEHARVEGLDAFSVATLQRVSGPAEGLLHPSLLTTLVYRFGRPGVASANPARVQANGQCFFARRALIIESGALEAARRSLCEDVTIARHLAHGGTSVGFYESEGLVRVSMYDSARDAWRNWTRSLPMRDRYFGAREMRGLAEVLLLMGLPLPLLLASVLLGLPGWFGTVQLLLVATRIGVLSGTARAYPRRPWTYWLSPLTDLAVALKLLQRALQRRHEWRGRVYLRRRDGGFQLENTAYGGDP